jgi:hypothetical protein
LALTRRDASRGILPGGKDFLPAQVLVFFLGFAQGLFYNRSNTAVKVTRRPLAVLKICLIIKAGGFAEGLPLARPLPLRWASRALLNRSLGRQCYGF